MNWSDSNMKYDFWLTGWYNLEELSGIFDMKITTHSKKDFSIWSTQYIQYTL